MKVKYPIDDHVIINNLNNEYGMQVDSITFLPVGDSAYSYKVYDYNGERYFLKLFDHLHDRQRQSIERLEYYLLLTWKMYHQGIFKNITYPIKNQNSEYKTTFNNITIVLFNFIEGETLAEAYPFSKEIVKKVVKSMAAIHQIIDYIDPAHPLIETFDISFQFQLKKCITLLENTVTTENHIKLVLQERVLAEKEQIHSLLNLIRELQNVVAKDNKNNVLCHGDLWGGNLICHENELYVIDWESAIMAPPEYDLFNFIGKSFEIFFAAYQKQMGETVTLNANLLRFYSYRHHLRNLTNWLMNILYRNTEEAQNENDLDMILNHCMNRWDSIEENVRAVHSIMK
ncbi:phosphotransferase [Bacillus sp. FSL K6-3431]|uniref:phosphotransferase n=1 Tax=Bacillus sp. FSL K6-3431 TaxID=2921500 RepID=UPI0030F4DDA3